MRKRRYLAAGFAAMVALTAPIAAQQLDEILAPVPGTHACWKRVYSDAHLASHPRQKVTEIGFYLGYFTVDDQAGGEGYYSFSMDFVTRERKGGVGGQCSEREAQGITCGGDCDSGAVNLRRSGAQGSLVLTALSGGFSLTGCEGDTQFWLSAEPDDKVFLVHPAACQEE